MKLTNTSQLQFSSLRASDARLYTCRATVRNVTIEETTSVTVSRKCLSFSPYYTSIDRACMCLHGNLLVPAPTTVTVTPSLVPIIVRSSTNLTCTVELSPLVDVPVNVSTEWTGPDGFMTTNTAQPGTGIRSTTTYASNAIVSSSGREQSGNYTCKATVRAMSSFIIDSVHIGYSSSRVIVGKAIILMLR